MFVALHTGQWKGSPSLPSLSKARNIELYPSGLPDQCHPRSVQLSAQPDPKMSAAALRKSLLIFHPIGRINHLSERAGWTQYQLNKTWHWSGRTKYWELLVDLCQKLCFSGEITSCDQTFFCGQSERSLSTSLSSWCLGKPRRCALIQTTRLTLPSFRVSSVSQTWMQL